MPVPFPFDFKNPDYTAVFQWRLDKLHEIRKNPNKILPALFVYYREHPAQFIIDWGMTFDPRNVAKGQPSYCPFILFPKQEDFILFCEDLFKGNEPGLSDKSREMGVSWMCAAYAWTKCRFNDGFSVGFGSRKQEYVDQLGDMKAILPKIRLFGSMIPQEFRGEWVSRHMRLECLDTQSFISGEAGDGIGRGDRTSIYFVDESAWLPRPLLVEASLSETTPCRIDISTPRGMGNPFARKRHAGNVKVFSMHWRDDPRKDEVWYKRKCAQIDDPVIIAQELDLDYSASMEGVLIPSIWVQAAIDAHEKLKLIPKGIRRIGYDVADEGRDKNAIVGRYGFLVEYTDEWGGANGDIYKSVEKVFDRCDVLGFRTVIFDSDGLGAGVRGDARVINERREATEKLKQLGFNGNKVRIKFIPFRGSGKVLNPLHDPFKGMGELKDGEKGRTNEDYFKNAKAQAWWQLRRRFLITYRAVVLQLDYKPEDIISIPRTLPNFQKLITELSQPTHSQNNVGQIIVDKTPEGAASPNLADALMIAFSEVKRPQGFFSAAIDTDLVE